jgi:phosphatidylglycerophosphatase A
LGEFLALMVATGFGVGYFPVAPGTMGSGLGIGLILLFSRLNFMGAQRLAVYLPIVALISVLGIWAASRAEKILGRKDPRQVVIDEIVGQLLTFGLLFRHPSFSLLVFGFIFFRLFDIVKPFPIRKLEAVPRGFGIILDDLAAGFYASLLIFLMDRIWPSLV